MTPEHAQQAEKSLSNILDATPDGPDKRMLESLVGALRAYNQVTVARQETSREQIIEPTTQSAVELLDKIIPEYRKHQHSPEVLTRFNRTFYEVYGRKIGLEISVPNLPASEKEVKKPLPTVDGKVKSLALYYPAELQGREGLIRLGRMFNLKNWSMLENTPIVSTKIPAAWLAIEGVVNTPNKKTNEDDLEKHAAKHHLLGQDLNLYVLGSRFIKFLEGCYFDQEVTWSRLPASRHEGGMLRAYCFSGGHVRVFLNLLPDYRHPRLGARFARVLNS